MRSRAPGAPDTLSSVSANGSLVVIGNFDGVHLGHQSVLRSASEEADKRGLGLTVLTFDPHPAVVLGRKARAVLTMTPRKVRLLEAAVPGLHVYVKHFDHQLAALSPEEFATRILRDELNARVVLVGENFRFGNGRAGDLAVLRELGHELSFEARVEALRGDTSGPYSSTRIRTLLSQGDVEQASAMLGRPHLLSGVVVLGDQRGRELGFPTANLDKVEQALPGEGVYSVLVYEEEATGSVLLGPGVANIGGRPTVDRPPSLEVHLLDFRGDLYGKRLEVTLISRVRAVRKFPHLDALKEQIALDVSEARRVTSGLTPRALV